MTQQPGAQEQVASAEERVRHAKLSGELGGISIDTSIYINLQLRLNHLLFQSLARLVDADFRVLMPDTIYREIAPKYREKLSNALNNLKKTINEASPILPSYLTKANNQFIETASKDGFIDKSAEDHLTEHLTLIKTAIFEHNNEITAEVLDYYFNNKPPFASTGNKKAEFPDAFALLSLHQWAKNSNRIVVVVSSDNDWERFCQAHPNLILFKDLGHAIQAVERAEEAKRSLIDKLTQALSLALENEHSTITQKILQAASSGISALEVDGDAYTGYSARVDFDMAECEIERVFIKNASKDVTIIDTWNSGLTVDILITAELTITGYFKFYTWDSIDREYGLIGHGSKKHIEETEVNCTIALRGESIGAIEDLEIEELSIATARLRVEFGEVEPDWADFEE